MQQADSTTARMVQLLETLAPVEGYTSAPLRMCVSCARIGR